MGSNTFKNVDGTGCLFMILVPIVIIGCLMIGAHVLSNQEFVMWESGSIDNNQILAVKRQLPLTGYIVIGFYPSTASALKGFSKHRLKTAIIFHIDDYAHDSKLPRKYANVD